MFAMRRIVVLDHLDHFKIEISAAEVDAIDVVEEINGVHTLTISTTKLHLTVGDRVLSPRQRASQYSTSRRYDEWVVQGVKSKHDASGAIRADYTCIWFVQYDSTGMYIDTTVGVTPLEPSVLKTAREWFDATIGAQYSWQLVSGPSRMGAGAFYNTDGWDAMKKFLERWGGELDCYTEVSFVGETIGQLTRMINIPDALGRDKPTYRFDFGWDVENIERTVHDGVWGCRVVPLGKSSQTSGGGYTRRPTISSVNGGVPWLENPDVVPLVRRPSDGGFVWFNPTVFVKNDTYEQPSDLKAWAEEHLDELTQPKVTYKVNALALGEMGRIDSKIILGDTVAVVDKELSEGGLRIEIRVRRLEYSLLSEHIPVKITLGNENPSITNAMMATSQEVGVMRDQMDLQQT